jgi:predicted flap endonuclease-1-like 5' DNA nuclease
MKGNTTLKGIIVLLMLFSTFIFSSSVEAKPILGVNYYGESLMGRNGINYIPRTAQETASDLDHIKEISNHLKIYMNPFVPQNIVRIEQILQLANARDMHTVVNMMVDDRQLDDTNWDDYSALVVDVCARLDGQTDEILVGNEIILRSSLTKFEIKDRVVELIDDCEQVFSGQVSYEEFWWAHDAWLGYTGRIYLMQYEGLSLFQKHTQIMENAFGANAIVGEWGEDLQDEGIQRDENWQREQIELRYNILSQTSTPVAYIFAYREQSWNAFGIVRPNGEERPVWNYLKSLGFGTGSVTPPSTNTTTPTNTTNTTNTTSPTNTTTPPANTTNTTTNTTSPPVVVPPSNGDTTTVYVSSSFMEDFNAVFVCHSEGFTPTKYSWDFGDGSPVVVRSVNDVYHSFPANGTYTVTCTASNSAAQETGGLTINVNGRAEGLSIMQEVTPLSNNNYNLNCEAIGYQPGYCQKITSPNGFSFDWGCTTGSPGYSNLGITLVNAGEYTLTCTTFPDSKQMESYYDEGQTYHVDACKNGGCTISRNMQFNVSSTGNIISNTSSALNTSFPSSISTNTSANPLPTNPQVNPPSTSNRRSSGSRSIIQSSNFSNISNSSNISTTTSFNNTPSNKLNVIKELILSGIISNPNATNALRSTINDDGNNLSNSSNVNTPLVQNGSNQSNPNPLSSPNDSNNLITGLATDENSDSNSTNSSGSILNMLSNIPTWLWILLGFIVIIVLTIAIISGSSKKDTKDFGDIYPVDNLEGIKQAHKEKLKENNVFNSKELLETNTAPLANNLGVSESTVQSWQSMADLSRLRTITPKDAKLLHNAGIYSINQLSNYTPEELFSDLNKSLKKSRELDFLPSLPLAHEWIEDARRYQAETLEYLREEQTA